MPASYAGAETPDTANRFSPHKRIKQALRDYQLDLVTPVISPRNAKSLKQIRQMPNFLIKARGLPQSGHLL